MVCALLFFLVSPISHAETVIMPLSDIRPGMEGEWRTVVDREGLKSFRLRVLGVARNMIGPKRDVILCEALDAGQKVSGPVAGMSGSPVYINGKLIGAYAYGFPYAKEQAIIGVQPIEHMFEVLHYPSKAAEEPSPMGAAWEMLSGHLPQAGQALDGFQPLPLTLAVNGFSEQTLSFFAQEAEHLGLRFAQTSGGGADADRELSLDAGMPIAGVLMGGDFNIAGTGTVTWRDGNRLLAFGHPFFQHGAVEIPMAGAEVLTVVQNIVSSFKFANAGKVVGTIYQDRQTAIAGEIGRVAMTTPVKIAVKSHIGGEKLYQTEIVRDTRLSSMLMMMALLQCVTNAMSAEQEMTVNIEAEFEFERYGLVCWNSMAGLNASSGILNLYLKMVKVLNNPFEKIFIKSARFNIEVRDGWSVSKLRSANILKRGDFVAGETINVACTLEHARSHITQKHMSLKLPQDLSNGSYLLKIVDAEGRDRLLYGLESTRDDFKSVRDYLEAIRQASYNRNAYLVLVQSASGLRIDGQELDDLPTSVRSLLGEGASYEPVGRSREKVLHIQPLDMKSEFSTDGVLPEFGIRVRNY